ncbi:hypothetical protein LTR08_007799 [Meristemomyces frigidus]|nr:hypothetical protein LTR08_007799 [Meristemomyces frigidus]
MADERDTLPGDVKPNNYSISLFDLQAGEPWTYQGSCTIDLEVKKSTSSITLNTHELKIHSAEVFSEAGKTASSSKASDISYDTKNQRCTFKFDHALPESPKAVLSISFEGTMNNHMAGFYRSQYKPTVEAAKGVAKDAEHHYMFSTQFESSDARRAFPCFDEPNLKATFDFEMEIPKDLVALSNMPEKQIKDAKRDGHVVVSFDRTPRMSTYLLAWAFGDFEYIEDFTRRKYNGKNLPVRVYTTKGLKEQGKLALESAHQVVDYFSEVSMSDISNCFQQWRQLAGFRQPYAYSMPLVSFESIEELALTVIQIFRIDYPLPKVDLLAVHEFVSSPSARMFSALLCRLLLMAFAQGHHKSPLVLYAVLISRQVSAHCDERQADQCFQSHGAMENWGLITYRTTAVLFDEAASDQKYRNRVVYVVAHELAHQWFGNLVTMDWWNELWLNEGFATWVGWYAVDHLHPDWNVWGQFVTEGMQMAFQLDSLRTSHPIEVPVRNALEVDQIFDHISYLKGSSVIRMLASYLGVETFLKGVSDYLKAHTYGNATTNDLWSALSKASGQDVPTFMNPWIKKIGFPVVTVAEEPGQITVRQSRFLSSGDPKPEEDETTWWIPLNLKTGPKATDAQREAFTTKEDTYRDIDTSFYKPNGNQTGFYRTNLPPQRLIELSKSLDKLSVEDKIGLVGDAKSMAFAGLGTTAGVLSFMEGFSAETNYLVWSEVLSSLGIARQIFSSDAEVSQGLRNFTLKLVSAATDNIGWEFDVKDDYLTGQSRALLLRTAGLVGHPEVVKEAQRRFKAYIGGDKKAIHPSLRSAVFKIAVKNGGEDAYRAVQNEYLTTTSIDGKEITLSSMGQVQTAELAKDYLIWGFTSGKVAIQDVHGVGVSLANNSKVRNTLWEFIKEHWPMLREMLGGNMVVLERALRMCLQHFADFKVLEDIEAFFKDKDNTGYDRGLAVASDTIRGNAKYQERDMEIVREWLKAHGYITEKK